MNLIKPKFNKNMLIKVLLLLFLVSMMSYPGAAFRGASTGLLLWFHNVLPNLLPFIILSNLLIRMNITGQISRMFHPILGRLLRISREGCYPVIFGILSGIPMGAKSTADMITENRISLKEGQFLVGMCNNASPMFILGYVALTQLKLPHIKYALFAIIYISAILGAAFFRILTTMFSKKPANSSKDLPPDPQIKQASGHFTFDLLDGSIMNGFEIVTRIGGYIILFSILAQILKEAGPASGVVKASLMGLLEITTGISQICSMDINIKMKIVLVSVLTTFGGFSGIAQTKSVLHNTRLSIYSYLMVKVISAGIALLLTYYYVTFVL